MEKKLLSLVSGCYNEERNIPELYERVTEVMAEQLPQYNYEYIFIDNASKDRTVAALKEIACKDHRVKVIVNTRNFGTIRSGYHAFLQAKGDAIISLVSDLQDPPELIPQFVRKWEEGFKIILAQKTKSEENSMFYLGRTAYYKLVAELSEVTLVQHVTGFGLYDRCVIEDARRCDDPYPYFRGMLCDFGYEMYLVPFTQPARKRGITSVKCLKCDFIFYNPRLEADEEMRLYADYRSEEYRKIRFASEPWYTEKFNCRLSNPGFITQRQTKLTELLVSRLSFVRPKILDFGGYRGELVKGLIADGNPWVYDLSGVTPLEGVGHCRDLAACKAAEFDLIVNTNVLEHVGFPRVLIDQITGIAVPGTVAYIEVPCESPFDRMVILKRAAQECVLALMRPLIALSLLKPGMLYLMHEHINFFTPKSLKVLMAASGWNVLAAEQYTLDGPTGKGLMAWVLAKK